MRVFYCTSFVGHQPVGTCALVVAEDEQDARTRLALKLEAIGLNLSDGDAIEELDTTQPSALILLDGDY